MKEPRPAARSSLYIEDDEVQKPGAALATDRSPHAILTNGCSCNQGVKTVPKLECGFTGVRGVPREES